MVQWNKLNFIEHWHQQATSWTSSECLLGQIENQKNHSCGSKNGTLRNTSINGILLQRLCIQNYLTPSITEKWQNKVKNPTWVCEEDQRGKPLAADLLKAVAILSDTIIIRSAVGWEHQNYTENQKKTHFSRWLFTNF